MKNGHTFRVNSTWPHWRTRTWTPESSSRRLASTSARGSHSRTRRACGSRFSWRARASENPESPEADPPTRRRESSWCSRDWTRSSRATRTTSTRSAWWMTRWFPLWWSSPRWSDQTRYPKQFLTTTLIFSRLHTITVVKIKTLFFSIEHFDLCYFASVV